MQSTKAWMLPAASFTLSIVLVAATQGGALAQQPEQGKWADDNDPVAKQMIEQERKWAIDYCVPSNVVAETMSDDFVGTSPDGPLYTKADLMKRHEGPVPARECKLLSARVRYYGPDVAMVFGSETAVRKGADGKEFDRTLIWTDTWLKRDGKWKIIAVQDMYASPKK